MRAAVIGATGVIGSALVDALAEEHDVVAVSRHPHEHPEERVRTVTADVADGPSLRPALGGADVVYYLVHSLGAPDFLARDREAAAAVAVEAERAGVGRLVYLGGSRRRPA